MRLLPECVLRNLRRSVVDPVCGLAWLGVSRAVTHVTVAEARAADGRGGCMARRHQLEPGDDWDSEIRSALRASDRVLLVASAEALASPLVRAELDTRLVDLRGSSDARLPALVTALTAQTSVAPRPAIDRSLASRPPVVRAVAGLLLGACVTAAVAAVVLIMFAPSPLGVLGPVPRKARLGPLGERAVSVIAAPIALTAWSTPSDISGWTSAAATAARSRRSPRRSAAGARRAAGRSCPRASNAASCR
jgi:hypothetical protein